MKTIAFSTALLVSGGVFAGTLSSHLEEDYSHLFTGVETSRGMPTAVQPGIGDSHDAGLFSSASQATDRVGRQGSHDAYGSILIDLGHNIDW
jgi:hypothetical protein